MRRARVAWVGAALAAVSAALTSWVSVWAWAGFVTAPRGFLVPALGVALLVAATGLGLRALRVPAPVVLVGQLAAVTVWLTHRWTPDEAVWAWLPTAASLRQGVALLREGVLVAQAYAAPVPESVPQLLPLLVSAAAVVALLVDLLACGLRRVPVAGLPLLAVYTAPVSILDDGVPWWVFVAGTLSFLALLATDQGLRLLHWGRQVGPAGPRRRGGDVGTTSLRISARRIGLTATSLAVAAPLVVPTLSGELLPGSGTGGGGGGSAVTLSNPMVTLRRDLVRADDVDLVSVRTEGANPAYLRISVLDVFNGETWKPSDREIPAEQRAEGPMPSPPGLAPDVIRQQVGYQVSVAEAFDSTWLPAPYPVTTIDAPGDWRYDSDTLDFISAVDGQSAAGAAYSLTALEVRPAAADLLDAGPAPESVFTPFTELPEELPDFVATLTRELTGGLDTRFEKAVRLQRWFREDGGFEYSLEREPGTGAGDLRSFLTAGPGGRVGYCEQFAAAMAVMGRTIGIPSRVAVGFLRADRVGEDEYVFSAHDLHAWPEMYFHGVGWVRFEPTPGDRASTVPGYTLGGVGAPRPTALPSAPTATGDPRAADRSRLEGDAATSGATGRGSAEDGAGDVLAVVLGLLVLLTAPFLTRVVVRHRRWSMARTPTEMAEAGWRELRDVALDLRLPWDDAVTVRVRARDLAGCFGRSQVAGVSGARGASASPAAAAALDRLVRDVEVARYSRAGADRDGRGTQEIRRDTMLCVEALRAGAWKTRRRTATWLPVSLLRNAACRALRPAGAPRPMPEGGVDRAV